MAKAKPDAGGLSKMKMVTQTLQEHGDIGPKEIQARIKEKYGADIPTTMISSYKSNIMRKQGRGSSGRGGGGGQIGIRDLTALKDLVDRLGASELQTLIKMLARK